MKIPYSDLEYEEMLRKLFVRFPSFGSVGTGAYKPGLERVYAMLEKMGNPHLRFRSIHVAGTNGKGSTCNMIAADLAASGMKVGLYTSPHILDFRERARIVACGEGDDSRRKTSVTLIPRETVWNTVQEYGSDFDELNLSFFEITTVLAFGWFASCGVDVAVIETGLGGRLDATNVIIPELSVITNIGYDHMDLLGSTLADIAGEKAGIIKPGIPVVIGESSPETDDVFIRRASALSAPLTFADATYCESEENKCPSRSGCSGREHTDALCEPLRDLPTGGGPTRSVGGVPDGTLGAAGQGGGQHSEVLETMDLKGIYQAKNLNTVLAALVVLGRKPDMEAISRAAEICDFHGRWETVLHNPLTICDIGHNEHGLKYNFKQLNDLLDSGKYSDLVMVYGSVSDKDVDAVLRILPGRARLFFAAADNHRAMSAAELYRRAGRPDAAICASVGDAVKKALTKCGVLANPLLYIGGSTYVVSEAMAYLTVAAKHNKNERQ